MITECYIKGRYDFGSGRCAVVITEDTKQGSIKQVLHKVAWKVPDEWEYNGETIEADQFNCEILAAIYALKWCMDNGKKLVNIYANTTTCQKWYFRGEFPDARQVMGKAYLEMMEDFQRKVDEEEGQTEREVVFADYIPKNDANEFNKLVNDLAVNLR